MNLQCHQNDPCLLSARRYDFLLQCFFEKNFALWILKNLFFTYLYFHFASCFFCFCCCLWIKLINLKSFDFHFLDWCFHQNFHNCLKWCHLHSLRRRNQQVYHPADNLLHLQKSFYQFSNCFTFNQSFILFFLNYGHLFLNLHQYYRNHFQ
jgi:hypothetical protein